MEIPESASDVPDVINIPEGATSEEMLDIIKEQVEIKADEASDIPEMNGETMNEAMEKAEQAMPSDIPQ